MRKKQAPVQILVRGLLYGDTLPNREGQPAIRAFTPQVMNEDAAMNAMRPICNQGVHHG